MVSIYKMRGDGGLLPCFFLTCVVLVIISSSVAAASSAVEFRVGGRRGWAEPTGNETETYNQWARRNRFHIGDYVYFKYENDSVLVVDRGDYAHCNLTSPILEFADGNTTFRFDRYGFFYFISGVPGHCRAGQKLVVRVMVHPEFISPGPAPISPGGGAGGPNAAGGGSGPSASPTSNSDVKLRTSPFVFVAAIGGALITLLFVY